MFFLCLFLGRVCKTAGFCKVFHYPFALDNPLCTPASPQYTYPLNLSTLISFPSTYVLHSCLHRGACPHSPSQLPASARIICQCCIYITFVDGCSHFYMCTSVCVRVHVNMFVYVCKCADQRTTSYITSGTMQFFIEPGFLPGLELTYRLDYLATCFASQCWDYNCASPYLNF